MIGNSKNKVIKLVIRATIFIIKFMEFVCNAKYIVLKVRYVYS